MMELTAAMVDRAVGVVLGSAVGDAMGAPYEFAAADPEAPCELEGRAMVRWYESGPVDVGNQTSAVLAAAAGGGIGTPAAALAYQERNPKAAGN